MGGEEDVRGGEVRGGGGGDGDTGDHTVCTQCALHCGQPHG